MTRGQRSDATHNEPTTRTSFDDNTDHGRSRKTLDVLTSAMTLHVTRVIDLSLALSTIHTHYG